jgi:hypothetical protein
VWKDEALRLRAVAEAARPFIQNHKYERLASYDDSQAIVLHIPVLTFRKLQAALAAWEKG